MCLVFIEFKISDLLKLHVYGRKLPHTHVKSVQCYC